MVIEYPENCGAGEDMKVDGNVGIGTTNPRAKLDVVAGVTGGTPLVVQNTDAYGTPWTQFSQRWLNNDGSTLAELRQDGRLWVYGCGYLNLQQ